MKTPRILPRNVHPILTPLPISRIIKQANVLEVIDHHGNLCMKTLSGERSVLLSLATGKGFFDKNTNPGTAR